MAIPGRANPFARAFLETGPGRVKIRRVSLAKTEICAIPLAVAGSNPAVDRLPTRRRRTSPKLASDRRAQPEIAGEFFYLIGRNPLKSPDSEKLLKGNESNFPFICFHLLSFICGVTRAWVVSGAGGLVPLANPGATGV
jgi:hypothetical protein